MSKHTLGPWKTDRNNCHAGQIATVHHCLNNDWVEIWSPDWPDSYETQEANATLISAAPDLLDACKSALACLGDVFGKNKIDVGAINTLRAAIAKATGVQNG